jgi:hypothetical protein
MTVWTYISIISTDALRVFARWAYPVSDEGRLDTSHQSVNDNTNRKEKANGITVDARHGSVDGRSTDKKVDGRDDLINQRIRGEDEMHSSAVADFDNLQERLRVGCLSLQLDSCYREQENLHTGSGGVPKGTRDAILIAVRRARQESSCNGPRRNDGRSSKTGLDRVLCRHEHFGVLNFVHVSAENPGDEGHADGEEGSNTDDDAVAHALREGCWDLKDVFRHFDWWFAVN